MIEQLGVVALVRSAGARSDKITDELFALGRLIEANPELRGALADSSRSAADKVGLLRRLLDGKVLPATLTLVEYAVSSATGSVERAISDVPAGRRRRPGRAAGHGPRRLTSSPTTTRPGSARPWDASTTATCGYGSCWSPTWWAGSGSRSATT